MLFGALFFPIGAGGRDEDGEMRRLHNEVKIKHVDEAKPKPDRIKISLVPMDTKVNSSDILVLRRTFYQELSSQSRITQRDQTGHRQSSITILLKHAVSSDLEELIGRGKKIAILVDSDKCLETASSMRATGPRKDVRMERSVLFC